MYIPPAWSCMFLHAYWRPCMCEYQDRQAMNAMIVLLHQIQINKNNITYGLPSLILRSSLHQHALAPPATAKRGGLKLVWKLKS